MNSNHFLTFTLEKQYYGISIMHVREIIQMVDITSVPQPPPSIVGILNLRGKIIPIMDLRLKMGIAPKDADRETCIIIVEHAIGLIGMIVDSVSEVREIEERQIERNKLIDQFSGHEYLVGIAKLQDRVALLLNLETTIGEICVLSEPEKSIAA